MGAYLPFIPEFSSRRVVLSVDAIWAPLLRRGVKRIVVTSSVRAVIRGEVHHTYTEEDWADDAVREVEEKKSAAQGMSMYSASKVLAERGASRSCSRCCLPLFQADANRTAAWNFHAEHKHEVNWDVVAIDLGWVFGVRSDGNLLYLCRADHCNPTADGGGPYDPSEPSLDCGALLQHALRQSHIRLLLRRGDELYRLPRRCRSPRESVGGRSGGRRATDYLFAYVVPISESRSSARLTLFRGCRMVQLARLA